MKPRPHQLDRNDRGQQTARSSAARDTPAREWRLRQPWPAGMRFENGRTDRVIDRDPLTFPVYAGSYVSTAQLVAEDELAEEEAGPTWSSKNCSPRVPRPIGAKRHLKSAPTAPAVVCGIDQCTNFRRA
jgi:hypothetical protein